MSLIAFRRRSGLSLSVSLATLVCFLATLVPPRVARADYSLPSAALTTGAGGSGALPGAAPSPDAPQGLATVDLANGAAQTSYTFELPPARGDAQPHLGLRYSSSSGVGFAGVGWTLDLPSIVRKGSAGMPRFTDAAFQDAIDPSQNLLSDLGADDFYIDGRLLIPICNVGGPCPGAPSGETFPAFLAQGSTWIYFRTEIDDGTRYFFDGSGWLAQTKSGHVLRFGLQYPYGGVELVDQNTYNTIGGFDPVYRWNLASEVDASGNNGVYYAWDGQQQLVASGYTAGTQFLTDIYDTNQVGTDPTAPLMTSAFAHHVHLTWDVPHYPYFTTNGQVGGTETPYEHSPVWSAPPFAQLTRVDVTSATWTSTQRVLVREYALGYLYNQTQTRSFLNTVTLSGSCQGTIAEKGGLIPAGAAQGCAGNTMPPTTYSYYGVSAAPPGQLPPRPQPANIMTGAFPASGQQVFPSFLMDLNGDGAAELVSNRYGVDDAFEFGTDNGGPVRGPTQAGATFGTVVFTTVPDQNGHKNTYGTVWANDWMWGYAISGNWLPVPNVSILQLIPPNWNLFAPFPGPNDENGLPGLPYPFNGTGTNNPSPVFLGQIQFAPQPPSLQTVYVLQPGPLSQKDVNYLTASIEPTNSIAQKYFDFNATHAFDIDGDGIPDMALQPSGPNSTLLNNYQSFFSTTDRAGVVHPFAQPSPPLTCLGLPVLSLDFASIVAAGAAPGSSPAVSLADIDGDGLSDIVIANKFGPNWSDQLPANLVELAVGVNRGDGRFGVPAITPPGRCDCSPSDCALSNTYANFVTPGVDPGHDPNVTEPVGPDLMQQSQLAWGDLNGDGLADYAVLDSHGLSICLRYGGWWDSPRWQCFNDGDRFGTDQSLRVITPIRDEHTNGEAVPNGIPQANILIGDIDGSGINQVLYFPAGAPLAADGESACNEFGVGAPYWYYPCVLSSPGDGTAFLMSPNGTTRSPDGGLLPRDGLLQSASNGLGATTSFEYATVRSLNIGSIPVPAWVVTRSLTTNGLSGDQLTTTDTRYSYDTPLYDSRDKLFVGFRATTEQHLGGPGSAGTITKTTFATEPCAVNFCNFVDSAAYHAIRGLPFTVETGDDQEGISILTTWNEYHAYSWYHGLDRRSVINPALFRVHNYLWGDSRASTQVLANLFSNNPSLNQPMYLTIPAAGAELRRGRDVDQRGNEVYAVDYGLVGSDTPILDARVWTLPPNDVTGWSYRVTQEQTGYVDPNTLSFGAEPTRETDYVYNPQGLVQEVDGVLSGTRELPGPPGAPRAAPRPPDASRDSAKPLPLQRLEYDSYGNVTRVHSALSDNEVERCTDIVPDLQYAQVPQTVTQYPNGCGSSPALTTSLVVDRALGETTSIMDSAGRVSLKQYDNFGRILELDQPSATVLGGTTAAMSMVYSDVAPVSRVYFVTLDTAQTGSVELINHYRYFDGLGDQLEAIDQAGSPATAVEWIVSGMHNRYNSGRVAQVVRPFFGTQGDPLFIAPGTLPVSTMPDPKETYRYDAFGRVTETTDFLGHTTLNTYNTPALTTKTQDAEQLAGGHPGSFVEVTADGHGRTVQTHQHLMNASEGSGTDDRYQLITYQATGEPTVIGQTSAAGTFSRWVAYDSLGRMVFNAEPNTSPNFSEKVGAPGVAGWTYAYNDVGELVGTSDSRGCGENIFHDAFGRVIAEDYSPCTDNQARYTVPNLSTGDGTEAFKKYDPMTGVLTDQYDRAQHSHYDVDPRGRLQTIARQLALPGERYALTDRYMKQAFTRAFTYFEANELASATTGADATELMPGGNSQVVATYTYDGLLYSLNSSYGSLISQQVFDASGQPTSQSLGDEAQTTTSLSYDANGALAGYSATRARAPGLPTSGTYAPPGPQDPKTLQKVLTSIVISRDAVGNPKKITDAANPAEWSPGSLPAAVRTFAYYDDYRLQDATWAYGGDQAPDDLLAAPYAPEFASGDDTYPPSVAAQPPTTRVRDQAFTYDGLGNMTGATSANANDAAAFLDRSLGQLTNGTILSGPHQLQQVLSNDGTRGIRAKYDSAGNMLEWTVSSLGANGTPHLQHYKYTWDELGRLATAWRKDAGDSNTVRESFSYDSTGNRIRQTRHDTDMSEALYDVQVFSSLRLERARLRHSERYEASANTEHVFLGGDRQTLAHAFVAHESLPTGSDGPVHTFFILGDHLGSTSFIVDKDTGELAERPNYTAYGASDSDLRTSRWGNFRENLRYTGHWDNAEVGLVYFGARYYLPQLARFASPDPLTIHQLSGDSNPYAYAFGNPAMFVDPTGLGACSELSPCPVDDDSPPTDAPLRTRTLDEAVAAMLKNMCDTGDCGLAAGPSGGARGGGSVRDPRNLPPSAADFDNSPPKDPPPFGLEYELHERAMRAFSEYTGPNDKPLPDDIGNDIAAAIASVGVSLGARAAKVLGSMALDAAGEEFAGLESKYAWRAVRAQLGKEYNLEAGTEVHHWLIPQGGEGRLTLKGFFLGEQWGRFVPRVVKNRRWNLMIPPPGSRGYVWSKVWHQGLHGNGEAALGLFPRLWFGTPLWFKISVGAFVAASGVTAYVVEGDN